MLQKSIFKSIFIFSLIGFAFTSCQKEEANLVNEPIKQITETGYSINVNKEFPQKEKPTDSKFAIIKYDYVEIMDQFGNFKTHKTKKVRKHDGTNFQEWIIDDLETDVFDFKYWNSDFGNFYTWTAGGVNPYPLQYNYNNDYDYLVYTDKVFWQNIPGFHIPTEDDLMTLGATKGNTNLIANFLELDKDVRETGLMRFNYIHTNPDGSKDTLIDDPTNHNGELNYTTMWVDLRQDGSYDSHYDNNPNCGIYAWFVEDYDYDLHYFLTNIPDLRTRVILVRDLPANEW